MIKYNNTAVTRFIELYILAIDRFYNKNIKEGNDIWSKNNLNDTNMADIIFFLDNFEPFIIEQEQINTIRELVNSKEHSNILIAFELVKNLNLKE